jgi:hypothetical protein
MTPPDSATLHPGYGTELKAQKLLFGGYSIAEIHELDIINEAPTIIK